MKENFSRYSKNSQTQPGFSKIRLGDIILTTLFQTMQRSWSRASRVHEPPLNFTLFHRYHDSPTRPPCLFGRLESIVTPAPVLPILRTWVLSKISCRVRSWYWKRRLQLLSHRSLSSSCWCSLSGCLLHLCHLCYRFGSIWVLRWRYGVSLQIWFGSWGKFNEAA